MNGPSLHTRTCAYRNTDTDKQTHAVIMFSKLWIRQHSQVEWEDFFTPTFCSNFFQYMSQHWINVLRVWSLHISMYRIVGQEAQLNETKQRHVSSKT